jgi:AraC-like DNA-binding protein
LRPGAAQAVFGCPARLIVNREVLLGDITAEAADLNQRLLATGNIHSRHVLLSNWVRVRLARVKARDAAVISACHRLATDPHVEIGTVAQRLGWNSRMMHRQFVAACGYGPKHFQRIMRMQNAIRAMHSSPETGIAEAAAKVGYADQAHMTRDFRSIAGFTPAKYIATAAPEFGAWISDEW